MIYATRYLNVDKYSLTLTSDQSWDYAHFGKIWEANTDKYDAVAKATNVPPQLVAAIHYRESGGDFTTYLLQGDKLGTRTWADGDSNEGVSLPEGREGTVLFQPSQWIEAAIFSIQAEEPKQSELNLTVDTTYLPLLCAFAEMYNGVGYFNRDLPSPYVLSGTSGYTKGKFVSDHHYDPDAVDREIGVLPLLWKAFNLSAPIKALQA